jgi:type IV pilus assembly protein PilA
MPKVPALPPEALMMIRGIGVLNELGGAVRIEGDDKLSFVYTLRTIWSNPDDVVAKIIAITPEMFFDNKAGDAAKAIADASPGSPFASDYKAGTGGLMAPMAVAGVLAAVAIPAFMDYMKKSKKSEAAIMLNRLGKSAKVYYVENGAFPTGEAPLTPVQKCCDGPRGKCDPAGAAWLNEAWTKLDFQIDEPTLFQYSYKSDGKTLDAEAIGDLDCDGTMITYKLHLEADQGNPVATISEPAPNSD